MWKKIKDFENYEVNELGQVRRNSKILKSELRNGYYSVTLSKNGKRVHKRIHRLIAEAFIPNPDNLPQVNHKNQNKLNNNIDNLEWCNNTYNSQYPNDLSVYCFDLDRIYKSATEASVHTGVCRTSILKACRGQLQRAGGMLWCYSKNKSKKFPS